MQAIATDLRRIELEPDFQAHERAVATARGFIEHQLRLARDLERIAATKTYLALYCASVEEYGIRLGLSWRDTRQLVALGHALDEKPSVREGATDSSADESSSATPTPSIATVEQAIRDGALSIDAGALAGRLLATPGLLHDGENAVDIATSTPPRAVRSMIRRRTEELAQQQAIVPMQLCVTETAKEHFARARVLASEKAGTMLTEGETFAVIVEHYVDCFDPLRAGEGARRSCDTAALPGQRYVPAEVRRAIRIRSGDHCEVPGCPRDAFLEFCHIDPHVEGGSREASNLVRLCGRHHVLLDAGRIRFAGWNDRNERPKFADSGGEILAESPAFIGRIDVTDDDLGDGPQLGSGQVAERPPPYGGSSRDDCRRRDAPRFVT